MLVSNPEALRGLRKSKGHSLRTLAKVAGLSHQAIGRLETGPVAVYPATAQKVAAALGVEIIDIATVIDDESTEVAS